MVLALGGGALFVLNREPRKQEAAKTAPGPSSRFVTREELQDELKSFTRETQWLLDEAYEKFSTLHARAEKAVQRRRAKEGESQILADGRPRVSDESLPRPSVPHYRRVGSV